MEAYREIRVILSYLATGTISQLCVYICLHSQVYASAIVMLTGVHTCEKCDITIYGLCHLTDIVYLWHNRNLCRIVF